ncbi:MAG: ribosome small subunit-dependent GTPase A [Candidatus Eisenbacteria sp.]|nr:ribosome small subunit-dependent GTPase A [Candidatus Eisenbacteria bacterium]
MGRLRGRVVVARGKHCQVETPQGRIDCVLRGILKKEKLASVDLVAVGDWVEVTLGLDGSGVIESIEPRTSRFSRPAAGRPNIEQVIVANATQLIICQSARDPRVKNTSIDRYLVMAEIGGLRPVICINKMDLDRGGEALETAALYRDLDLEVLLTTAIRCEGVEEFRKVLAGEISILVGPSGVGKSTLLNCIQPGLGLRVQEVSRKWSRGKHTTSSVELFPLDDGGWVGDTPGLRELGLWGVGEADLAGYFREFETFAAGCRFATCTHSHEPGCGVAAAVEEGRIRGARYDSYLRILQSLREPH